jgi:hypothetical protein
MILPTKHTNLSESILGLAGFLLSYLKTKSYNIDELWFELKKYRTIHPIYKTHSFDNLVMAVDLLFLMGSISMDHNGKIRLI